MDRSSIRRSALILAAAGMIVLGGAACKKKVAATPAVPAPPAPAPSAPTVKLTASPDFITQGETSTLRWTSTNASQLNLQPGVGSVEAEGSTGVTPSQSTTYTITAAGPGGNAVDTVRVTVAPPKTAQPSGENLSYLDLFNRNVKDAFFDFNKADIRPDARQALTLTAEFLRAHPNGSVTIEGHCDERGSLEYNLGLGQRRADAAKDFLTSLGIAAGRMKTMSWGKEHPFCTEHTETCWQENRRAHFVPAQGGE